MNADIIIQVAGIISAVAVIFGTLWKVHQLLTKIEKVQERNDAVDKKLKEMEAEQCMQTYVLEALLDGMHQLGCNGKTTEASDKLSKFINKKAHNQHEED